MKKSKKLTREEEEFRTILDANQKCKELIREICKDILTGSSLIKKDLSGFSESSQVVIFAILQDISVEPIRFTGRHKGMIFVFREWIITEDLLTIKTNNPDLILHVRVPEFDFEEWFETFL